MNQELKDENFYKKLNEDPTREHSDIVNNIIASFKKQDLQSTSTAKKLTTNDVRALNFIFCQKHINQAFPKDYS